MKCNYLTKQFELEIYKNAVQEKAYILTEDLYCNKIEQNLKHKTLDHNTDLNLQ